MSDLDAYDYELPKALIAQEPARQRVDARLMVVHRRAGEIEHAHIRDLTDYVAAGDTLVVNDSRVIPARLSGVREATGGRWQGLFLETDPQGLWKVLGKTRGKIQPGERISLVDRQAQPVFRLRLLTRLPDGVWAARPEVEGDPWALLDRVGRVPLPPYIRGGEMIDDDLRWYQTVFAARRGSVAAPTAGLHLTESLLSRLQQQDVGLERVTLHVGIGTFRPVSVARLADHAMHAEWGELTAATATQLDACRRQGGRVVAVGTTSVRVLESAALAAAADVAPSVGPYRAWSGQTRLFIRPPFQFQAVDALLTNFHLPRSTLLVLVRTFGGDRLIRHAYEEAVRESYRFFSYGDAMLIL